MKNASIYSRASRAVSTFTGSPAGITTALGVVTLWALVGPLFSFNNTWQSVINTGTQLVTFLMVFLIQASQNRDTEAMQVKLDELIRATEGAHNTLLDLEELDADDIAGLRKIYNELASKARKERKNGLSDGTPSVTADPVA